MVMWRFYSHIFGQSVITYGAGVPGTCVFIQAALCPVRMEEGEVGAEALSLPMPRPPPRDAHTSRGPKWKPRKTAKLLYVGQTLWCLPGLPRPLI